MRYSPESLQAFVQTVESGSFSAAARALRKSQSTISMTVANLETDLGLTLFSREARSPVLTEDGQRVLVQVREILAASDRLDELAIRLCGKTELRLSMAFSDYWQADHHALLKRFAERYPVIELECMIAEDADLIDLLLTGRVHIGVIPVQSVYPSGLVTSRLQSKAQRAIYLHQDHPLAQQTAVSTEALKSVRQLCLNTWIEKEQCWSGTGTWSAPSYLLLLEMAEQGFGWTILPRWLVEQFGHQLLRELPVSGWPQAISVDVAWSRHSPPGPAGRWVIDQLLVETNG